MKRCTALLLCIASLIYGQLKSPADRVLTAPQALTSRANAQAGPIAIDELFYTRIVAEPAWSADGREVVFTTDLTGRLNLWKVAAAGGWPMQLSQSDDREMRATASPDGKWIVYQQDFGGGEYYDLFAVPANGGEPVNLTRTRDVSETDARWSPDSKSIAFIHRVKTSAAQDIGVLDFSTHATRMLTHEPTSDHFWRPEAWSRDQHFILANRSNADRSDSSVYRIDVSTGDSEELTPHKDKVNFHASSLSPDGRFALIESNQKYGSRNIAILQIKTHKLTWVTDLHWDATAGNFSPDGSRFTYSVNQDGRTTLYIGDQATLHSAKIDFPEGESRFVGSPTAFSPAGDQVLILHQGAQRPTDLWIYDLKKSSSRQLTFSALAGLDPQRMPPSQLVHYRTFDGQLISAFLWLPDNLQRDGSNPGIVMPHGGPTGQTLDTFNRTATALASRGYVCIAPNVRGSTGYGFEFQRANHKDLGGGDLQDEVYAARFLAETGYVDAKRIGITGGSYGGYMTLMAIGKTPELWAAAVEQYGIINWFTMLQHEDPELQEYQKSLIGDPVKNRKVYEDDSPITFIRQAKAPLLVLQGDNDIRVPKEEAMQVADILEKAGTVVSAHYYPGEGHGFVKRENQIDAIRRTIDWFDRYLKKKDDTR